MTLNDRDVSIEAKTSVETKPAVTEEALLLVLEKFFEVVLNLPTLNRYGDVFHNYLKFKCLSACRIFNRSTNIKSTFCLCTLLNIRSRPCRYHVHSLMDCNYIFKSLVCIASAKIVSCLYLH